MVENMKAIGSIEFSVKFTTEEISKLEHEVIKGILRFRSDDADKDIPIEFVYDRTIKDGLVVSQVPDHTYMGKADKISVTLSKYHYTNLKELGHTDDRYDNAGRIRFTNIDTPPKQ